MKLIILLHSSGLQAVQRIVQPCKECAIEGSSDIQDAASQLDDLVGPDWMI